MYFESSCIAAQHFKLSSQVGIMIGQLLSNYLGVPIFRGSPTFHLLRPIAYKILSQVVIWKGKSFSYAMRVCLVNYVITSQFFHSFSIYKWLISILKELNRAIRNYIWSGLVLICKIVLVNWDQCCLPQTNGRFGLKNLIFF